MVRELRTLAAEQVLVVLRPDRVDRVGKCVGGAHCIQKQHTAREGEEDAFSQTHPAPADLKEKLARARSQPQSRQYMVRFLADALG